MPRASPNPHRLLPVAQYIHANPVIHDLVEAVADWPYSNYLEWTGDREGTLVDRDFVHAHFPTPDGYREFVAGYPLERRLPQALENYLQKWERS